MNKILSTLHVTLMLLRSKLNRFNCRARVRDKLVTSNIDSLDATKCVWNTIGGISVMVIALQYKLLDLNQITT